MGNVDTGFAMSTIHISDDQFEEVVLKSRLPVLVDFFATWCAPCHMAAPVLEELSTEYDGKIVITKMDIDNDPKAAGKYGISSIPSLLLFVDGEVVDHEVGFQGKSKYDALIQKGLVRRANKAGG